MRPYILKAIKAMALATVISAALAPATVNAELAGSTRSQMEQLDMSEHLIRNTLYAPKGRQVFDRKNRRFVRGVKLHNAPLIYEPDVYTWELAMAEHRQERARLTPDPQPSPMGVTPAPMTPAQLLPATPQPLHITPLAPQTVQEYLPQDAQEKMNQMVYRARARSIDPNQPLRASELRQKLVDHMNRPAAQPRSSLQIPALMPALPPALPPGRRSDSFDSSY